jgi:hypothetical protein
MARYSVRPSPGHRKTVSVMIAPLTVLISRRAKLVMMVGSVGRRI